VVFPKRGKETVKRQFEETFPFGQHCQGVDKPGR
jgi:hypothetical protein